MKLIIDIPENWQERLNEHKLIFADIIDINTLKNGTPLDDIRTEILKIEITPFKYCHDIKREALEIIDKYKAKSEE